MKKNIKYIILFLLILIFNLIIFPTDLDEIWLYGFSHNMYNGLIPYLDFNMIVTPLYNFILSIPFYLFGSSMLIYHISQALLFTGLSYFLFDLLKGKAWFIILFCFFPVSIFSQGYNVLLFYFFVLLVWLEKNNKNDYIIGVILALSLLTKQSVGVMFLLPSLIYIKNYKKILKRFCGFIIPCLIFLIYLICSGSLYSFIDLCILGLFDFATGNGKLFNIYFILTLFMILITVYFIRKDPKDINMYYILAFYSVCIPLFDLKHFQQAFLALLFGILYNKNFNMTFNYYLLIFGILLGEMFVIGGNRLSKDYVYPNNINHFEYRFIEKDVVKFTNKVNKYLEENDYEKFVFLDSNGYYFKIINDIPISSVDLLNIGNFGYNGSDKLFNIIKDMDDYVFIIDFSELERGNQTDKSIIKYVLNHGKKIDSIEFYDVYKLK